MLIFCIVLFLYLHIFFHLKTINDLEVYEVEEPSKDKLEEICDMGFEKSLVSNIINMVISNEYKRRQYCPGVKVTHQSFGRERRFQ